MICRSHLFEDDQYRDDDDDDDDDDDQHHAEVKYLKLQFGVLLLGIETRVDDNDEDERPSVRCTVMIVIVIITSTFNIMVAMTQKMKNRCT